MPILFLSDPIINKIETLCEKDSSFFSAYKKVKGKLRGYAGHIGIPFRELKILNISDGRGDLHQKLIKYIGSLPCNSQSTAKNVKYKLEILSILRRVLNKILEGLNVRIADSKVSGMNDLILERQTPQWMSPLHEVLPRETANKWSKRNNPALYRKNPLTEKSRNLLETLLRVAERYEISTLESLLVDHSPKVNQYLNNSYPARQGRCLYKSFQRVRQMLGMRIPNPYICRVYFRDWSDKFQQQWKTLVESAARGIPAGTVLARSAFYHNIPVKPISENSLNNYRIAIEKGLHFCVPLPDQWGIEDLMTLHLRINQIGGIEHQEYFNQFVDKYHVREQERVSDSKRAGYDSSGFSNFIGGLRAVAAFNGFFHLIQPFKEAYSIRLDMELRNQKKDRKKKLCSVAKIDRRIAELESEFNLVVSKKTFVRRQGVLRSTANGAMNLCLFYVALLILRFVGLRQQNVRHCRIMRDPENPSSPDGNIGLRRDGTIVFHYEAHEIKNKKRMHIEFSPETSAKSHGFLIRGLTLYLEKVYPYVQKKAITTLDRELLVYMPFNKSVFAKFPNSHNIFYQWFTNCRNSFLSSRSELADDFSSVHPHFLRGLCADWLISILQFTIDEAAEYMCDDPITLKEEYIDRNRIHNATVFLNNKNRALRELDKEQATSEPLAGEPIHGQNHLVTMDLLIQEIKELKVKMEKGERERTKLSLRLEEREEYIGLIEKYVRLTDPDEQI